jgi:hypothetical protein
MTAGNMTAALHLVLDDKISSGLKLMTKQLDSLRDAGKQIGLGKLTSGLEELRRGIGSATSMKDVIFSIGSAAERSGQQIKRMAQDLMFAAKYHATLGVQSLERGLNNASRPNLGQIGKQFGVIGGAAAGYSVMAPIQAFSEQELLLRHIAITEKKSGPDVGMEVMRLNKMINSDALETGQSSESVAKAYSDLVQRGIPSSVLDKAIKAHSRAATAYNVPAEAMGPAVAALLQNMKIPEADLGTLLARMAYASKEGAFKIEDFSRQLPGVTGRMVTGAKPRAWV